MIFEGVQLHFKRMKNSYIPFFLLSCCLLSSLSAQSETEPLAPALYVFGDSQADSGNNNGLVTQAKANYAPYGVDFVDGITGRFTNGNTFVDFIAELLGLPYVPPYLGLSEAQRSNITTGVNYASGAAGILPETGTRLGENIPLEEQIKFFQRTVKVDLPQNFNGSQAVLEHLRNSIFIIEIGSNDYINNYLQPNYYNTSKYFTPQAFAVYLVTKLGRNLMRLYGLGARKIVVFELGILGCIPAITNAVDFSDVCVEDINQMVLEYNRLLAELLEELNLLPRSIFVRGLAFAGALEVYQNPSQYGFTQTNVPCCITANHGTTQCLPNLPPCENRNQSLFWDAFHPTQAANALTAIGCFNQSTTVCTPLNIQQLAEASINIQQSPINIQQLK